MYIKSSKTTKVAHLFTEGFDQTFCLKTISSRWVEVDEAEVVCAECLEARANAEAEARAAVQDDEIVEKFDPTKVVRMEDEGPDAEEDLLPILMGYEFRYTNQTSNDIKAKIAAFETLFNRKPFIQAEGRWMRAYGMKGWFPCNIQNPMVVSVKRDYIVIEDGIEVAISDVTAWRLG